MTAMRQGLERTPDFERSGLHLQIARFAMSYEDYDAALSEMRAAEASVQSDNDRQLALRGVAQVLEAMGRLDEAIVAWSALIDSGLSFPPDTRQRGIVLDRAGRKRDACRDLRESVGVTPEDDGLRTLAAGACEEAGELDNRGAPPPRRILRAHGRSRARARPRRALRPQRPAGHRARARAGLEPRLSGSRGRVPAMGRGGPRVAEAVNEAVLRPGLSRILDRLCCPRCRTADGAPEIALAEASSALTCARCGSRYPVVSGVPDLRDAPGPGAEKRARPSRRGFLRACLRRGVLRA
jgi:uncharacterized protein YbaR (Trm112 family)